MKQLFAWMRTVTTHCSHSVKVAVFWGEHLTIYFNLEGTEAHGELGGRALCFRKLQSPFWFIMGWS